MQAVEEIKKEREKLEKDLKDSSFDMSKPFFMLLSYRLHHCLFLSASTFLKAMADSGTLNDDQISITKLNEIYSPIREEISNSIRRQETVMNEVQVRNLFFKDSLRPFMAVFWISGSQYPILSRKRLE